MTYLDEIYSITNISDTKIIADNLDRLVAPGALKKYLAFNRYTGEGSTHWYYSDGKEL